MAIFKKSEEEIMKDEMNAIYIQKRGILPLI